MVSTLTVKAIDALIHNFFSCGCFASLKCIILYYYNYIAPNVAPKITTSYAIDSSTVVIHWDPLPEEDCNGIVREYEVFVCNVNTGKNQTVVYTTTTAHTALSSI